MSVMDPRKMHSRIDPTAGKRHLLTVTTLVGLVTLVRFVQWAGRHEKGASIQCTKTHARQRFPIQRDKTPAASRARIRGSTTSKIDSIWFLETSGRRKLKARVARSIESACRHNRDYTVHLLSTGNISFHYCPYHRILEPNFRTAGLNASAELAWTPLARLHDKGGKLHRSPYFAVHLSDFLRYAVIWKRGGVYLDTDIIVTKSLKGLQYGMVHEVDGVIVANCILFFARNHPVIGALIEACSRYYNPKVWSACGPPLTSAAHLNAVLSRRVKFLPSWTFLKVHFKRWQHFFDPAKTEYVLKAVNRSYGVHFWNAMILRTVVMTRFSCAVDLLARAHCPSVCRLVSSVGYL